MWTPVAPHAERQGRYLRLYSGPRYVRHQNLWRRRNTLVHIADGGADGTFVLSLDDKWIRLRPLTRIVDAIDKLIIDGDHFGPLLHSKLAPNVVQFEVDHSDGVTKTPRGWKMASYNGVDFGLFLDDWTRNFGFDMQVVNNRITLNLTEAKLRGDRINLDPGSVDVTTETGFQLGDEPVWADARTNLVDFSELTCSASFFNPGYFCGRGLIQFLGTHTNQLVTAGTLTLHSATEATHDQTTILIPRIIKSPYTLKADATVTPDNGEGLPIGSNLDLAVITGADQQIDLPLNAAALAFVTPNDNDFTCFFLHLNRDVATSPTGVNTISLREDGHVSGNEPVLTLTLEEDFTSMVPGMTEDMTQSMTQNMLGQPQ